MAQAEFERNKQQGGFDSTSYRAAEPESGARVLTPLQQKLAGLEKTLPAALRSRVLAFVLAAAVLGWLLSENLIEIFLRNDPLVIEYGSMALRLQCITFPLVGWITISNMMLQTIGRTVKASLLAMSRQFLFFVPAVLLLPNFLGMLGVQLSQPIADVFSFLLAVPLALSELKDMKRLEEQLRIAPQADEM